MNLDLDTHGNLLIAFDNLAEAEDFMFDLDEAIAEPGTDIESPLISENGVATLTVRVDA